MQDEAATAPVRFDLRPPLQLHPSIASVYTAYTSAIRSSTFTDKMAVGSRDLDGDSEMASSVGSVHSDSDVVDTGARTPTHNAQTAASTTSELSPPGSQPQQIHDISTTTDHRPLANVEAGNIPEKGLEQPVAAWKSKRAQDEYQRAMEQVIDKDFNLNEFGDPFDERDLEEKLS